ncbi:MAG TPA: sigma-70 family RNA polymerase sigma factor [Sphingomonas sp.]|uniref:sigma-70 family RNA polymerase sigma factor n=1 Tax=Sphingomonas sp. TaxID=28214 RepID=UPI002CEDB482|nr:sigma-70 family RNA polymerase sigma factor [Sphingomonas sp.]HMI19304.1 sigma-70 family RNA polymerase sigma factor [Sphingomonas sp.]
MPAPLEPIAPEGALSGHERKTGLSDGSVAHRQTGETGVEATPEDLRLFARVRARERDAFEALYRLYHPRLARFLLNLLHRPQLVEEVLNDTLFVVWDRSDTFRGASKLSTWIFAIAYRKAMKALRRLDEPIEDRENDLRLDDHDAPDAPVSRRRAQEALLAALARLSPDHRAVVDLTYFHEMGYREIAEIVDCPVDTVKTRMFHARRHLRRMFDGELADWL